MPVNVKIIPILPKDKKFPVSVLDKINLEIVDLLLDDIGPDLRDEYKKQVEGWSNPPEFPVRPVRGRVIGIEIIPRGSGLKKWTYVNKGTRSRTIRSRGKGPMIFPKEYTPKTTPGGKYGGPGLKHGDIQRTHTVRNHKIEPREFEEKIITPAKVRHIERKVQQVVDKVTKKYG